ncbi:CLUMA_CG015462, isoform A [Clunio marinus]|uniref:Cilia- and flagella-associated protein 206 n=1 Tax=Clunio marinus TaxID=568069 RepID=A0A1J1IQ46_9DIPT|nr:CLUMA_CG015462, isoform A [Clunio marinus]
MTEISNALSSIMTETDFENFGALESQNRMESLKEIRLIVCGIVLFNKDTGQGSTMDIPDLTKSLLKSYESIESLLQFTLCDIMDRVNILTTAFDGAIEITKSNKLNLNFQSCVEQNEIDVMKDLLILNRQHEIYVRKLLSNMKSIKSRIESHVHSYGEKLMKLHDIVQYRSAVPSVQIFPKFKELTGEWMILHDLSYTLSQQSQINNYLQHLSELCRQQQFDDVVHKLLGENQVETDLTRLRKRQHLKFESTSYATSNISIVQPPESNSEIGYLGFCTFVLAEGRILLPSVPEMGTILWNQKTYGFYSIEAADHFIGKPERFTNKIQDLMLNNVHLILFFDIYNVIKLAKACQIDVDAYMENEVRNVGEAKVEREIQTELHPISYDKDQRNIWNLWDLRRKAIDLTNLKRKKTTSAQTSLTYFKLDIGNQRYGVRQKSSQTVTNKAINTE